MNLPLNQIIQGDAIEVLKTLPTEDFITLTDPPYNQGYHYENGGDDLPEEEYIKLLSVIKRPAIVIHYPEETINILPKILGKCDDVIAWVYPSNTGKQHRLISFWGLKPDRSKVKQPYKNLEDKRIIERMANGAEGADSYDWLEINQVKNVSEEKTDHPCQIPVHLVEKVLLMSTKEGDTVFDPFGGSGTTAVACANLKRNYICIEKEPKYVKICHERIASMTKGMF